MTGVNPFLRIIPARAGNTRRSMSGLSSRPDHPRAGGEHACLGHRAAPLFGSSPRGRGTHADLQIEHVDQRIIPARAGNTARSSCTSTPTTDHPRAGGEHNYQQQVTKAEIGSSPRGRGTRLIGRYTKPASRIIPARAGNTRASRSALLAAAGSSPRGRGTRQGAGRNHQRSRIIPARAGNTAARELYDEGKTDHPRAGGEHIATAVWSAHCAGSSPRGRGTHRRAHRRGRGVRIIPARAGNTRRRSLRRRRPTDHPRAGGEHDAAVSGECGVDGSSPRGRGTPGDVDAVAEEDRIIPARAGNTRR